MQIYLRMPQRWGQLFLHYHYTANSSFPLSFPLHTFEEVINYITHYFAQVINNHYTLHLETNAAYTVVHKIGEMGVGEMGSRRNGMLAKWEIDEVGSSRCGNYLSDLMTIK